METDASKTAGRSSRRTKIVLLSLLVIVVVALALGLGLYYGLDNDSSSDSPSPSSHAINTTTTKAPPVVIPTTTTEKTATPAPTEKPTHTSHPAPKTSDHPSPSVVEGIPICPPGQVVKSNNGYGDGELYCADGEYSETLPGVQSIEGHTNQNVSVPNANALECQARVDVPEKVLQVAIFYRIEYQRRKKINNWSHDYRDRTGYDPLANAYGKSFTLYTEVEGDCFVRGRVVADKNNKAVWESDPSLPNIATTRQKAAYRTGPYKWPTMKKIDVSQDPDICNGQNCCVADDSTYVPDQWANNWNTRARSLEIMCSPIYKPNAKDDTPCKNAVGYYGEKLTNCGFHTVNVHASPEFQGKCSCLAIEGDQKAVNTWGGLGLDCTDIVPGGKHFDKDMFWKLSWALNKYYKLSSLCGGYASSNVQFYKSCKAGKQCYIPQDKNIHIAYGSQTSPLYLPGGHW
eukprot:Nk52_evm9s2103 gene=Nk52_evmTU9s2103